MCCYYNKIAFQRVQSNLLLLASLRLLSTPTLRCDIRFRATRDYVLCYVPVDLGRQVKDLSAQRLTLSSFIYIQSVPISRDQRHRRTSNRNLHSLQASHFSFTFKTRFLLNVTDSLTLFTYGSSSYVVVTRMDHTSLNFGAITRYHIFYLTTLKIYFRIHHDFDINTLIISGV